MKIKVYIVTWTERHYDGTSRESNKVFSELESAEEFFNFISGEEYPPANITLYEAEVLYFQK